jgi:hypothetical protein
MSKRLHITPEGKLIYEEESEEAKILEDLRKKFFERPLKAKTILDLTQEMRTIKTEQEVKKFLEKKLGLHKYPEDLLTKAYDSERLKIYEYYKSNF